MSPANENLRAALTISGFAFEEYSDTLADLERALAAAGEPGHARTINKIAELHKLHAAQFAALAKRVMDPK